VPRDAGHLTGDDGVRRACPAAKVYVIMRPSRVENRRR
jgi:hypothetical protein